MTLIKTSLLNGIAVVIKMLTLLGVNKILALYVGPSGYAAIGQLQNALTMITSLSSGAVNTGVIKYTAEYVDQPLKLHSLWKTSIILAIVCSLIIGIVVALLSSDLSLYFFKTTEFTSVFQWVSVSLIFFTVNLFLLSVINGRKDIYTLVWANILGSILSLIVITVLTAYWGLYGALISLVVYQAVAFVSTVLICFNTKWFKVKYFFGKFDKKIAFNLSKYAAMALTTAACVPLSQILIRNHLVSSYGADFAGYWEAMWRLSSAYLLFVTTTLGVYYLPRLSEITCANEMISEILNGYKILLPLAFICSVIVFLARDIIINILFSSEFTPMRELFAFQLFGDVMKIGSWILAYVMLGKSMFRLYISTEIIFSISFYFLVLLFTHLHGFEGVVEGYAVNYVLYWVVIGLCVWRNLKIINYASEEVKP
ncbi:O-antigen translocase [Pseudomonas sp. EL_65y_Pfl2_R95]|uniref:O-antigen translocase n=1 Tax=Pseudomonas sp. EL_65y_Pfl2_R95 TaxID=3088698 RepID=UPI0030DD29D4